MGALHNVMLADSKSRVRAVEAGIAKPLLKVLTADLMDDHVLKVRARLLMGELIKVQGEGLARPPDMHRHVVPLACHETPSHQSYKPSTPCRCCANLVLLAACHADFLSCCNRHGGQIPSRGPCPEHHTARPLTGSIS